MPKSLGRQKFKKAVVILPPKRMPSQKAFQKKTILQNCSLPSEIVRVNNLLWVAFFLEELGASFSKGDALGHLKKLLSSY